jgi:Flp pilus assembly protein TadG
VSPRPVLRGRLALVRADRDQGSAIVEFVFVAILMMVPMVYLIVAVAVVQRAEVATVRAARSAGRASATSPTRDEADGRARAALRLALANQGFDVGDAELKVVAAEDDCAAAATVPTMNPGSTFAVCVSRRQQIPAIPGFLQSGGVLITGRYVVHMDDFRVLPK